MTVWFYGFLIVTKVAYFFVQKIASLKMDDLFFKQIAFPPSKVAQVLIGFRVILRNWLDKLIEKKMSKLSEITVNSKC
jgi:hypothetical protein